MNRKQRKQRVMALMLVIVIAITSLQTVPVHTVKASNKQETNFQGNGYQVTFGITSQWNSAFNATVIIKNTGDKVIDNWAIGFYLPYEITKIWNGTIHTSDDGIYVIKNVGSNQDIEPNKSISFGFSAKAIGDLQIPSSYLMMTKQTGVDASSFETRYQTTKDWKKAFNGEMKVKNTSNTMIEDWIIEFDFPYQINQVWRAQILSRTGDHYVIKNSGYNANIKTGKTIDFAFSAVPGEVKGKPENIVIHQVSIDEEILNIDSDSDLLSNSEELKMGTNPLDEDTDQDGLPDGYEKNILLTDPLNGDSDNNQILDGNEDFDQDLLKNIEEYNFGTHPYVEDTDGDNISDYQEIAEGTDPLTYNDNMQSNDDVDRDSLTNIQEKELGTDPHDEDTDEDGFSDYYEVEHGMDPLIPDDISLDESIIGNIHDNTMADIEILNINEYYPIEIEYNEDDTQVTMISGKFSDVVVQCPNDVLYALYSVKSLLGLEKPEEQLRLHRSCYSPSGPVYTFKQYFNDVEVYESFITISTDFNGKVNFLRSSIKKNNVIKNSVATTAPMLSVEQCNSVLHEIYPGIIETSTSLVILFDEHKSNPKLVYYSHIWDNEKMNKTVFTDANTGTIIRECANSAVNSIIGCGFDEDKEAVGFPVNKDSSGMYRLEDTIRNIYVYDYNNQKETIGNKKMYGKTRLLYQLILTLFVSILGGIPHITIEELMEKVA